MRLLNVFEKVFAGKKKNFGIEEFTIKAYRNTPPTRIKKLEGLPPTNWVKNYRILRLTTDVNWIKELKRSV